MEVLETGPPRRRRLPLLLVVVGMMLVVGSLVAVYLTRPRPVLPPPALGADADSVQNLDQSLNDMGRKSISWNTSFMKLADPVDTQLLDAEVARGVRHHIVTLEMLLPPKKKVPSGSSLLQLIASRDPFIDGQLARIGRELASWQSQPGHTDSEIILRPLHEANTDWYPWGFRRNRGGNTPQQFKAAWYHIQGLLHSRYPALKFFWCANSVRLPNESYAGWYPGDQTVDYVGDDSYNRLYTQPDDGPSVWRGPQQAQADTIRAVRAVAPKKPYIVGEMATTDPWPGVKGRSKAEWYTQLGKWLRNDAANAHILVVCYFDADKRAVNGNDWRIYPVANPVTGASAGPDPEGSRKAFIQATAGLN